ncbi:MAG: pentapeptide repeat-containing protein [Pseudomonadota bacterium]
MANEEHLRWLHEGVQAWNERIRANPFRPDLMRAVLPGAELENFDLAKAELVDVDLAGANLRGADLMGAEVRRADLIEADLGGANLRRADLGEADLIRANLRRADLKAAGLEAANLERADLREADLREANLGSADLRGAIVRTVSELWVGPSDKTDFRPTDLRKTLFLTQTQLNQMDGDRGTLIPSNLVYPDHWPDAPVVKPEDARSTEEKAANPLQKSTSVPNASVSEIRARLSRNYKKPAALTAYLVEEVQRELAAHSVSIPNEPEGLARHAEKKNFLTEQLVALQVIHKMLPEDRTDEITEGEADTLRAQLIDLADKIYRAVEQMDAESGTFGGLWKFGLVSGCAGLLTLCGVPFVAGAAVAGGSLGVHQARVLIEERRRDFPKDSSGDK